MEFYSDPAFFIVLAVSIVIAAVLGLCEKRLKYYGFAVSCVFILLLFSKNLMGLAAFAFFIVVSAVCFLWTRANWKSGKKSVAQYRVALALTLLPLVVCKVSAVFDTNLLGFIGISYLTFRAVQVLIEIRDDLIEDMSVVDYFYFVTFFTTFTSGPIDRSRRFVEDANRILPKDDYVKMLSKGLFLMLFGAVYYFVFAGIVAPYNTPGAFSSDVSVWKNLWDAAITAYAYGFYLFFNFAGYSLMAIGAGYCFGIEVPRNFKAPFAALDMKDFWNRWHITLSFWLRDYVFMRFTRVAMKRKWFKSRLTTACVGYMVNMIIMGAWHGLTPSYLAYGLYQGLALALTDVFQKKSKFYKAHKNDLWFKAVSWFITLNIIMFGFALFSGQVALILGGMFNG